MAGGGDNDPAKGENRPPVSPDAPRDGTEVGSLPFGTVLGKYRIVDLIGRGGMGIVYRAEHVDLGMLRALKTLAPEWVDHPLAQARFLKEAKAAARISHPHVVKIFDSGSYEGLPFFVMEYLEGEDLASALTRTRLTVEQTAGIMLAICAAISELHEQGLIHRDLKPGNIFLARDKVGNIVPTVLDFGIVKPIGAGPPSFVGQTQDGDLVGTVHYISPEQLSDFPAGERSDQYALGVILYQSVIGRRPFEGESAIDVLGSVARFQFPRPSELRPDLPPEFETVILTAMRERPADRYPSVYLLGKALFPFASSKHQSLWADYYGRVHSPKDTLTAPIAVAASSTWLPRPDRVFVTQPLSYGGSQRPLVSANAETTPMSRGGRTQPLSSEGSERRSERPAAPALLDVQPSQSTSTQPPPAQIVSISPVISGVVANAHPAAGSDLVNWGTSDSLDNPPRIRTSRFWLGALLVLTVTVVVLAAFWSRLKPAPGTSAIENAVPAAPAPASTSTNAERLRPAPTFVAPALPARPSAGLARAPAAVPSAGLPPAPPAVPSAGLVRAPAARPSAGLAGTGRAAELRGAHQPTRPPGHRHTGARNLKRSSTAVEERPATAPPAAEPRSTYPAVGRTSDSQYPAVE